MFPVYAIAAAAALVLFGSRKPSVPRAATKKGKGSRCGYDAPCQSVLQWLPLVRTIQAKHPEVPIPVILATIHHESKGHAEVRGHSFDRHFPNEKGEFGLMQLMPSTAHSLGIPFSKALDPATNIDGGVRILAKNWARYKGDVRKVFSAYNAGSATSSNQAYVNLGMKLLSFYANEK